MDLVHLTWKVQMKTLLVTRRRTVNDDGSRACEALKTLRMMYSAFSSLWFAISHGTDSGNNFCLATTQIKTRRNQHPQECKDPRPRCFCDSWSLPLTFWPQISRTHCGTFCQTSLVILASFLRYVRKKQTNTVKRRWIPHPRNQI